MGGFNTYGSVIFLSLSYLSLALLHRQVEHPVNAGGGRKLGLRAYELYEGRETVSGKAFERLEMTVNKV